MYLGYRIQSNNDDAKHIEHLAGKANAILGRIWSLGERKFKEDWERRMKLFDALVRSVMLYGADIWGFKEWTELEKIQDRYIKWTVKVDRTTPSHILHEETNRWKIAIQTGNRAMKYEQKLLQSEEDSVRKECMRKMIGVNANKEMGERRRKFYENKGWAANEVSRRLIEGETVWPEMMERAKDEERQKRAAKIGESRFAREIGQIINHQETSRYLKNTDLKKRKELETQARFRLGSENRSARYWCSEIERGCRMCQKSEETLKHIFEECEFTRVQGKSWKEILNGE